MSGRGHWTAGEGAPAVQERGWSQVRKARVGQDATPTAVHTVDTDKTDCLENPARVYGACCLIRRQVWAPRFVPALQLSVVARGAMVEEVWRVPIPKLDVDNYATWSTLMQLVLEIKDLWDTVADGLDADADAETRKRDRKARAGIGLCVEFHHLPILKNCKTAKSLWDVLKKVCQEKCKAKKPVLNGQLLASKKGLDEPIIKYLARAKQIRDQLISAGAEPSKQLLTVSILKGLPAEYGTVTRHMQLSDQELTLESLDFKLQIVEQNFATEKRARPGYRYP